MAAARSVLLVPCKSEPWKEFGGATNLIGWRFRACHEYMNTFVDSWNTHGERISFEEIYAQERALFGMFSTGASCIESMSYALNALASHSTILGVPFGESEQRGCNPTRLRELLNKHPDGQSLAATLATITESQEWRLWIEFRNRMTHRSNLPRIVYGAVGSDPPPAKALQFAATSSTRGLVADASHLESLFDWLAQSLRRLLVEGRDFASRH